jgi:hypothetical protein
MRTGQSLPHGYPWLGALDSTTLAVASSYAWGQQPQPLSLQPCCNSALNRWVVRVPPLTACMAGLCGGHGRLDSFAVMVGVVNGITCETGV